MTSVLICQQMPQHQDLRRHACRHYCLKREPVIQFLIVLTQLILLSELQLLSASVAGIFIRRVKLEDSSSSAYNSITKLWSSN